MCSRSDGSTGQPGTSVTWQKLNGKLVPALGVQLRADTAFDLFHWGKIRVDEYNTYLGMFIFFTPSVELAVLKFN